MKNWPFIRAVVLFVGGFAGEAVMLLAWWLDGRDPNQTLILLFAAMMGLPAFLGMDEKKGKDDG